MLRTVQSPLGSSRAIVPRGPVVNLTRPFSRIANHRRPTNQLLEPRRLIRKATGLPLVWRVTYSSKNPLAQSSDPKDEKKLGQEKLGKDPEHVTSASTIRAVFESSTAAGEANKKDAQDIGAGIKGDLVSSMSPPCGISD